MGEKSIRWPQTTEEWNTISSDFYDKRGFPHVLGAVDGKHIIIRRPSNSGSLYYCYKKSFTVVLLAVCDSNYKFLYAQCGSFGSESDGGIFANSELKDKMENEAIPVADTFNRLGPLKYYFLGDAAFALSDFKIY